MSECEVCRTVIGEANTTGLCRRCYSREYKRRVRWSQKEYITLDEEQRRKCKHDISRHGISYACRQWMISQSFAYKLRRESA